MNQLKDYILLVEDAISFDLCDAILSEYKNEDEWEKTGIGDGRINEEVRSASTIVISASHVMAKNSIVRHELDRLLFEGAGLAIKKYSEKFSSCKIHTDSGYELLRYNEGQFYQQHIDSFKCAPRSVSCSFALNDNYEGGEWGFFDRKMIVKVPKGAAILFPANFMYPHEIMPVTQGSRYSIITWFL